MKEEIERTLQPLIGEPLSDMFRFVGIQAFEFGIQRPSKNRKGEDITLADQRLHVSCAWRVTCPEGDLLLSDDFGPGTERRDEKAKFFYARLTEDPLYVTEIEADDQGGLRLRLTDDHALHVQPDNDTKEDDTEQWRYLPIDKTQPHLVLTAEGIERYDEDP